MQPEHRLVQRQQAKLWSRRQDMVTFIGPSSHWQFGFNNCLNVTRMENGECWYSAPLPDPVETLDEDDELDSFPDSSQLQLICASLSVLFSFMDMAIHKGKITPIRAEQQLLSIHDRYADRSRRGNFFEARATPRLVNFVLNLDMAAQEECGWFLNRVWENIGYQAAISSAETHFATEFNPTFGIRIHIENKYSGWRETVRLMTDTTAVEAGCSIYDQAQATKVPSATLQILWIFLFIYLAQLADKAGLSPISGLTISEGYVVVARIPSDSSLSLKGPAGEALKTGGYSLENITSNGMQLFDSAGSAWSAVEATKNQWIRREHSLGWIRLEITNRRELQTNSTLKKIWENGPASFVVLAHTEFETHLLGRLVEGVPGITSHIPGSLYVDNGFKPFTNLDAADYAAKEAGRQIGITAGIARITLNELRPIT